jgi:hypothetical protein
MALLPTDSQAWTENAKQVVVAQQAVGSQRTFTADRQKQVSAKGCQTPPCALLPPLPSVCRHAASRHPVEST